MHPPRGRAPVVGLGRWFVASVGALTLVLLVPAALAQERQPPPPSEEPSPEPATHLVRFLYDPPEAGPVREERLVEGTLVDPAAYFPSEIPVSEFRRYDLTELTPAQPFRVSGPAEVVGSYQLMGRLLLRRLVDGTVAEASWGEWHPVTEATSVPAPEELVETAPGERLLLGGVALLDPEGALLADLPSDGSSFLTVADERAGILEVRYRREVLVTVVERLIDEGRERVSTATWVTAGRAWSPDLPSVVPGGPGVEYRLEGPLDRLPVVEEPTRVVAGYLTFVELTAETPYGTVEGAGTWHRKGSAARWRLDPAHWRMPGLLGALGGYYQAEQPEGTVVMDGPTHLVLTWRARGELPALLLAVFGLALLALGSSRPLAPVLRPGKEAFQAPPIRSEPAGGAGEGPGQRDVPVPVGGQP